MQTLNIRFKQRLSQKMVDWYNGLTSYREERYVSYFNERERGVLLGLGISNGALTTKVAKRVKAERILGIDLDKGRLSKAQKRGIETLVSDLNQTFPVPDSSVDVVSSDQVIEHLQNTDLFVSEIFRVLKSGGYAVVCTENLSSWHNLLALFLGQQAFSQQISESCYLGNKFSPHYKRGAPEEFPHQKIFTKQGLVDLFERSGFAVEKFFGIGYFPIFNFRLSRIIEKVDPTHSYFIGVRVRKR